jgi:hypothetical protein
MRCANLGNHDNWVVVSRPDIAITRSGFDTVTQVFEKADQEPNFVEEILQQIRGSEGPYVIGESSPFSDDMYVTSSQVTSRGPGVLRAVVTYTGIYEPIRSQPSYSWVLGTVVRDRQLFKPVEVSMRCYADEIVERDEFAKNYILRIPRLTVVEKYVTKDTPINTEIGQSGQPIQAPQQVQLPSLPDAGVFDEITVNPNGWILNTRNWSQVLDKPIYAVTDEWTYQTPTEYVNVTPA